MADQDLNADFLMRCAEARRMANEATDQKARQEFLTLAKLWERLAARARGVKD